MNKFYEVKFYTKKGGEQKWIIHIEATNAKEARAMAEEMWSKDSRMSGMHMFGIKVKMLKNTEEFCWHYFALCA